MEVATLLNFVSWKGVDKEENKDVVKSACQLWIQSGVKMWTRCVPSGLMEGSSKEGIETNRQPPGSSIVSQSSTMM